MYFISEGRVRILKHHGSAASVVLSEMGPGDYFGEMSLVESVVRSASAISLAPTTVFTLRGIDFFKLYKVQPAQYGIVVLNIARDLSRRLRGLDDRYVALSH